ncbi:MAG: 1,4-alpha-glucan branching enzyme, partial [Candidatus Limivicinus sp.]
MKDKTDRRVVFTGYDSYLFHEGTHYELFGKLGAHPDMEDGVEGTRFLVWAPHAVYASVITAKTCWENERWMHRCEWDHGVWECFLPGVGTGDAYRYVITGADGIKR